MIYNIEPAPQYPDEPMERPPKIQRERHNAKESAERFRDNMVLRNRLKEKFITGRLYAHLNHEEMKK